MVLSGSKEDIAMAGLRLIIIQAIRWSGLDSLTHSKGIQGKTDISWTYLIRNIRHLHCSSRTSNEPMEQKEQSHRPVRSVNLPAHTIIETVVSLTIASIVFTLGFMIYLNVVQSIDQEYQVYLQHEAKYHLDSLTAMPVVDEEVSYVSWEGLDVDFKRTPYENYEGAWLMECLVSDSLFNAATSKKIIYLSEDKSEE